MVGLAVRPRIRAGIGSALGLPQSRRAYDWLWFAARIAFATNWAFNAFGKYSAGWYQSEFAHRVSYFSQGNPWSVPHDLLRDVVLEHPSIFAALAMVGETAAALLLLLAITARLGGAMALIIGVSYTAATAWINIGYAVHNGSFAVLGLAFLLLGARLPATGRQAVRLLFGGLGAIGLIVGAPMVFWWEGPMPGLPWVVASAALLMFGLSRLANSWPARSIARRGSV